MRLGVLDHGHRLRARIFIRLIRLLTGQRIDAVAQKALYRPEFFGRPMFAFGGEVLRGQSYWTSAEREFLAVYNVNDRTGCRPELVAVLPLPEKATRKPDEISRADIDAVRAAGVPDEAIVDALHVNLVFNIMNRLANAFDLAGDSDEHLRLSAKVLHRIDYRLPSFLTR